MINCKAKSRESGIFNKEESLDQTSEVLLHHNNGQSWQADTILGLSKFCMSHQFRRITKLERENQGKGKYLEINFMKSKPSLGRVNT